MTKQQFCACSDHAFFYTFPCRHCIDYDVKLLNFMFFLWMTVKQDNDLLFLFVNLDAEFRD